MTRHLDVTELTVARSLRHSDNLPPSGGGHSASRLSSRVARWEGPWVHLTIFGRVANRRISARSAVSIIAATII